MTESGPCNGTIGDSHLFFLYGTSDEQAMNLNVVKLLRFESLFAPGAAVLCIGWSALLT